MKLSNAIKKLSKIGEVKQDVNLFWVELNEKVIEFMLNGSIEDDSHITCIKVRDKESLDDAMSDYSAGVWCDNLTQAITLAGN